MAILASAGKYKFHRGLRLLTPDQFKQVFQNPNRASTAEITILATPNQLNHPRLGLAIPKKHLKLANQRNRIKRLCREYFRLHQHSLPACDFVVIAKAGIGKLDNSQLTTMLNKLWLKHSRLAQN